MASGRLLLFPGGFWMLAVISRWLLDACCYFLMASGCLLLFPGGFWMLGRVSYNDGTIWSLPECWGARGRGRSWASWRVPCPCPPFLWAAVSPFRSGDGHQRTVSLTQKCTTTQHQLVCSHRTGGVLATCKLIARGHCPRALCAISSGGPHPLQFVAHAHWASLAQCVLRDDEDHRPDAPPPPTANKLLCARDV